MLRRSAAVLLACVAGDAVASAQLVAVRYGAPPLTQELWYVDVATDERIPLTPAVAHAVAVDDAAGAIWLCNEDVLSRWTYGSPNPPAVLGTVTLAGGGAVGVGGLASGAGRLFALDGMSRVVEIDTATLVAVPVATQPALTGSLEGLAFHAQDGMFYAANYKILDSTLYRLDLLGAGTATELTLPVIAPFGMDLGGLAAHAGRLYLVPDDHSPVRIVDLATGQLAGELTSPFPGDGLLSGAEWAPSLVPPAGPRLYCTPKASSSVLTGFLTFDGDASASAGSGFALIATQLSANQIVWFAYSTQGAAATPFAGGTLCLAPPIARLAGPVLPVTLGASRIDFNAHIASGADPALAAGAQVWVQALSRNPSLPAGEQISMSQGLTTVIQP